MSKNEILEIVVAAAFIIAGVIVFIGAFCTPILSTLKKYKEIDDEKAPEGIKAERQ